MAQVIARVMVDGDIHLSSKNYGGHIDYPQETLYYAKLLIDIFKNYAATHRINSGDFSYGRFSTLEYRLEVEKLLREMLEISHGRYWIVKGNHDKANYGMTEYEYYLNSNLFKGSESLSIGKLHIHMRDYNDFTPIDTSEDGTHVLITHGYFLFENSNLPDYGVATKLDNMKEWYGLDYILCGHIHEEHIISGYISNGEGRSHPCTVHYLPCLSRPAYHGEDTPTVGSIDFIDVYDDGQVQFNRLPINLLPIEQSFDIERIKKEKESKEVRRVDLSDVVNGLNNHEITVGNPEDVIMAKANIPLKYREKAVELLKSGLT